MVLLARSGGCRTEQVAPPASVLRTPPGVGARILFVPQLNFRSVPEPFRLLPRACCRRLYGGRRRTLSVLFLRDLRSLDSCPGPSVGRSVGRSVRPHRHHRLLSVVLVEQKKARAGCVSKKTFMVSESESNHPNCFTTSNDDTWLMSHWLAVGHLVRELVRDSVNLFQMCAACCMYQKCA